MMNYKGLLGNAHDTFEMCMPGHTYTRDEISTTDFKAPRPIQEPVGSPFSRALEMERYLL